MFEPGVDVEQLAGLNGGAGIFVTADETHLPLALNYPITSRRQFGSGLDGNAVVGL